MIKIKELEKKSKKKLSDEEKEKIKVSKKEIKKEIIEYKLELLLSRLFPLDIDSLKDLQNYTPSTAKNKIIKSLFEKLYMLDTEYKEFKNIKSKDYEIERKKILERIKKYKEQEKKLDSFIEKMKPTAEKIDKMLEPVLPYFSPINPINIPQFLSEIPLEDNESD